jgi:hypothetical protein
MMEDEPDVDLPMKTINPSMECNKNSLDGIWKNYSLLDDFSH